MRYPLLFQRILENMPQGHPQRGKVLTALHIVDKISREVQACSLCGCAPSDKVIGPLQVDEHKFLRDKETRMVELYNLLGGTQEVSASINCCEQRMVNIVAVADYQARSSDGIGGKDWHRSVIFESEAG